MAALSYRQVSDLYKTLKDSGVVSNDLPGFSGQLNELSGTQDYAAGLNDNFVKQASTGIDRLLEASGLPTAGEYVGRQVGSLVGAPDVGAEIGHNLPRMAANFAPLAAGPWGLPAVAALSGAETYTNTGSSAAGLLSGATNALMPGVANLGENAVLRALGTKALRGPLADAAGNVVGQVDRFFPNVTQKVGSFLGGQAAAAGFGEASSAAQAAIDPNGHYQFSPTTALLNMTLGQVPFAAMHLAGKVVGREANAPSQVDMENQLRASQTAIAEKAARDAMATSNPLDGLSNVGQVGEANPNIIAETNSRLAAIRNEKQAIMQQSEPDIRRYDQLSNEELDAMMNGPKDGVMGQQLAPDSDRFNIVGNTHFEKPGYRIVRVADDPSNADLGYKSGQLIGYSTKFEPGVMADSLTEGRQIYSIPKGFHDPNVVDNQTVLKIVKPATPEGDVLPEQPVSGVDRMREQAADFTRVKTQLDNVQEGDTEGLRQALEATNGMRQKWGYEPLTDEQMAKKQGATNPLDSAKGDVNSLMSRIARKEELMQQRAQDQVVLAQKTANLKAEFAKSGQGDIANLEHEFNTSLRAGSKPGLFDQVLNGWNEDGRQGGFEGLANRLAEAKRTGGIGKPKVDPTVAKTEVAAKDPTPATEHIRELRRSVAETVTDEVGPDLEGDAQEFRAAFADGSLTRDKSLSDFLKQGHVQEWKADAEQELAKLGQHEIFNPIISDQWHQTPIDFPITEAKPFTHFGSKESANAVWWNWKKDVWEGPDPKTINLHNVDLNINNPIRLKDSGTTVGSWAGELVEALHEKGFAKDIVSDYDQPPRLFQSIIEEAKRAGYDAIVYNNEGEKGGDSYIIFDKSQVIPRSSRINGITNNNFLPQPQPFEPQTDFERSRIAALSPDEGGVGLLRELARSENPAIQALSRDLATNFGESSKRIKVRVLQTAQEGLAQPFGNRETEIQLSHALVLSGDVARREQVMMHELLHGLTLAELDNPLKKEQVQELEDMRQRVIDQLPQGVKAKVQELVDSNWLEKYATNQVGIDELKSDPKLKEWQGVMYGLLDNKEFVSQGFTEPKMQKLLSVLKNPGEPKGNVFVRWVKRLFGFDTKISDTEFSKFLDVTSNILKTGNWVSDLSNFTDQWYADKGYAPTLVRDLSRRALDIVQSSALSLDKDLINSFLTYEEPITKSFADAKQRLTDMYSENGPEADAAKSVLGELQQPQDSLDTLLTEHLGDRVSDMDTAMQMLPDQVTRYLFERAADMKEVLGSVKAAVDEKNNGLINIADPTKLRGPVNDAITSLDKFLQFKEQDTANRVALAGLAKVAPDAYLDSILRGPSAAGPNGEKRGLLEWVGDAIGNLGGRSLSHFLQQPAQIARSNPTFGEWYSKALLMKGKVHQMVAQSMNIFSRAIQADGSLGPENVKQELDKTYKALASGKLQTALNKLIYLKQERGGDAVRQIDYNDPEVQKLMSDLSPSERTDLISLDNKVRLSKVAADQQTLKSMQDIFSTLGARLVIRDMGLKLDKATALSSSVFDAVNTNYSDPRQAQIAQSALAAAQSKMTPEAFLHLLKFTQDSVEQHQTYAKYLGDNPDWVSAQRNGSFLFEYMKNGKTVLASAENKKEALQRTGGRDILNWRKNNSDEDSPAFLGDNANTIIPRLRELENNQFDMLKNVISPEDLARMQRTSPVAQFERETNASQRGSQLDLKGRTLSRGADELPWFSNHLDWVQKNASYWQRRLLRTQGESMLMEPGTESTPTADLIRQHIDSLMQKDPEIGRAIQQVTSTWSLGFNLASQIANATQTHMRGLTELIGLGHGPLKSLNLLNRTWSDYIGHKVSDKPYKTGEEQKFLKDSAAEGQIDSSIFDDDAAAQANSATNFKRILSKDKPKDLGQYLSTATGAYQTAGMFLFKHGERANNEVMLLSAFRALKELHPELSYDELKRQAYLVNASVNDVGGRANRSLGLYSGKGDFARTAAMTMSSLQSYMLGSTFQLIRNLKAGFFRPQGLEPSQVYAARKAAVYQLATQFAAAGALGMPFVSGSLALINQMFPELEVNKKLREGVADLFHADSANGQVMTDMALSGVPSMMGWDWGSRLNAGNVLPGVSDYDGFQPEQLLGVPFSVVSNFVKGAKQVAGGDASGGYAFVPPGIKKIVQLANNGGQLQDYKNRPLMTPTTGEAIGAALGFNPTRLTQFNAADRMAQQSQEQDTRSNGQLNQTLAQETLKGNFGSVRQILQQQVQQNPNYNATDAVRSIARAAEDLTFPKDLRQGGNVSNGAARSRLLSSFSLAPSQASEVARLQFRQQIEQRLGLVENDKSSLVQAQVMDQLRGQRPDATRAELRSSAQQFLRRTQPSQLALQ